MITYDKVKAANDLTDRDHQRIVRFLKEYGPGKLGAYFVPPIFFSASPEVIILSEYDEKTKGKGKHKDGVKGQIAERAMFVALKDHFKKSKDDVLVLHSHKFLDKTSTEKDFIVVNVTKGYLMVIEVKANISKYQKAKKQLFDSKERIEEICHILGPTTKWLFVGVFYAHQNSSGKPIFDCEPCSVFGIVGEEAIGDKLAQIDENATKLHDAWVPSDHLEEFGNLVKELMFIAQGDPKAPVTDPGFISKVDDQVKRASTCDNILFWTPEQLSLIGVLMYPFVFLDAFYSTGKSVILQYFAEHWSKQGKTVHYFVQRPDHLQDDCFKLPFTLMLEHEFKKRKINVKVRETTFKFGFSKVKPFLKEYGIEKDHIVCFDEIICKQYSRSFSKGLNKLKDNVAALWLAIGAKPVVGSFSINAIKKSGFICPTMRYPLRNPIEIAQKAHRVSQDGAKNRQRILGQVGFMLLRLSIFSPEILFSSLGVYFSWFLRPDCKQNCNPLQSG